MHGVSDFQHAEDAIASLVNMNVLYFPTPGVTDNITALHARYLRSKLCIVTAHIHAELPQGLCTQLPTAGLSQPWLA